MLDLTILNECFFELKLLSGEVINIKKLTQGMTIAIDALDKQIVQANNLKDAVKILKINSDRVHMILNHNKEKKIVTREEINEMHPEMLTAILIAYSNWMTGINNNPN